MRSTAPASSRPTARPAPAWLDHPAVTIVSTGARGGPAGDLYVFLSVRRHQLFEREGADVHCRVPISMVQATLGDWRR